ncbi:MAG: cell division FtsA domain-containing protein, partial [Fusobacteriaceae bacterium]
MQTNNSIIKNIIDLGNSKIKVLVGELYEDGQKLRVLAYAESSTQGLKKSTIENPSELTNSIENAIFEVEKKLDMKIKKVIATISSPSIKSRAVSVKIDFAEKQIGDQEIEKLLLEAEKELVQEKNKRGENKKDRILKKELYNVRVNNSGIVKNPIGMVGKDLRADIHLICIDEDDYLAYEEVLNRSGLEIESIMLGSFGSAEAVLDDEEKNKGVALIDIGEGITDILMFKNGKLIYSKTIPLGGMHYISDLAYILETSKVEATKILDIMREKRDLNSKVMVGEKSFTIEYIRKILDARTDDIVK